MKGGVRTQLLVFSYLQFLDLLSTMAFLAHGVVEGNPLVNWAICCAGSPLAGLVMVKSAALTLGAACSLMGRQALLIKVNLFYAALVVWNLIAIILGSAAR